jgi:hypothetical protein
LNSYNGKTYVYYVDVDTNQWIEVGNSNAGPTGPSGLTGSTGPTGPTGMQGPTGSLIFTSTGNPESSEGNLGDIYVDLDTDSFWGPKTISGWPAEPFFTPTIKTRHVHTQALASDTWLINHTLGGYPSVTIVDSASTVVVGEILYISTVQVQVSFASAFSGFAYLT